MPSGMDSRGEAELIQDQTGAHVQALHHDVIALIPPKRCRPAVEPIDKAELGLAEPRRGLSAIISNTVPGELAITRKMSAVAVSRSSASSRSRRSWATLVSLAVALRDGVRPLAHCGRLTVWRRCAFNALPPVFSRRLIAFPEAQDKAS